MHLFCPLKKFCISIVFNFSWDGCDTQEKWKTKVMQNFRGQIRCLLRGTRLNNQYLAACRKLIIHVPILQIFFWSVNCHISLNGPKFKRNLYKTSLFPLYQYHETCSCLDGFSWLMSVGLCMPIGHFRVPPGICFKTRVRGQPLIWKSYFILMQIKLIFTRKIVHLASFWKWGFFGTRKWPILSFFPIAPRNLVPGYSVTG